MTKIIKNTNLKCSFLNKRLFLPVMPAGDEYVG